MLLCRRQQRIINTSKYPQTHTSSLNHAKLRLLSAFCIRILTVCNWLILTSGPKSTGRVPVSGHFTSRTRASTRITAKFSIRLNFPTALYYLNTTRSLDIKRRLRQISYHQAKGQIVISNTNTGGISRVYRDEKLLGFACLLHLGCAF